MSDADGIFLDPSHLDKLSVAQLGALKMVGGDLSKLPEATLLDMKSTLSGATPSTGEKIASGVNTGVNWLGTQFAKGVTGMIGAPRAIGDMNQRIAEWGGEKLGVPETGKAVGEVLRHAVPGFGMTPTAESGNKIVFNDLGLPEVNAGDNPALTLKPPILNGGEINVGKMLDVGAQAIPSMLAGPAGPAASALSPGARAATTAIPAFVGGAGSEAAGQATAGTPWELPARVLAGGLGYLTGGKAVTPFRANLSPEEARTVALAKQNNIPMTAGTETGNPILQWVENRLAGTFGSSGRMAGAAEEQAKALQGKALKTMGVEGDNVGTETMKRAGQQASAEFEAAKNMPGTIDLPPTFFGDIKGKLADYKANTSEAGIVPSVEKNVNALTKLEPGAPSYPPLTATAVRSETPTLARITQAIQDADLPQGALPAGRNQSETLAAWFGEGPKVPMPKAPPSLTNETYQSFRKTISDTVNDLYKSGETGAAKALQKVRDSLDDAAGASLPADQMEAWKTARTNYANYKILEKAAGRGTSTTRSEGTLSPTALTQVLRQRQGDAFSRTTGGLNDVARIGEYLGTAAPRPGAPLSPQNLLSNAGSVATLGLPANMAARTMTGSQGFGWLRDYLANQAMVGAQSAMPGGLKSLPFSLAPGIAVSAPQYPRLERRK